jgi:hypothetical protein
MPMGAVVGRDDRRMPGCDRHVPRRPARVGEAAPRPDKVGRSISGRAFGCDGWVHPPFVGVRRCLTRPAREGRQSDATGCRGAATIAAGAVGSERPGLKPRAQSASPLKGAVRRTGAWVDRLGAGAVGISRLQPAWGLSPAVHGRADEERAARLICGACRARRVGHVESPRRRRARARRRLAPTGVGRCIPGRAHGRHGGADPRPVGARHRLTRHPRATVGTPRALNTMGAVPVGTVSGASPRAGWTGWPEPW